MSVVGVYFGGAVLALLSVPVVVIAKRRFEECLPVGTVLLLGLLFLFGVCHALGAAVYAAAALAVLLFAGSVFWMHRHGGLKAYRDFFLTPGFFVFAFFVLALPLVCARLRLWGWDEFSHWGLAAKEMFLSDAMGYRPDSRVTMWGIPPFMTLFHYFFLKLCGGYSEPVLYAAQNLMTVVLLLPFCRWIPRKKWGAAALAAALFAAVPLLFFSDFWLSLYNDCLMGLGLAYVLTTYFCARDKGLFELVAAGLGACFVVMIKNMGLEYIVIPVAIMGLDFLFLQKKKAYGARLRRPLRRGAVIVLCLVLAFGAKAVFDAALYANGRTSTEISAVMRLLGREESPAESAAEDVPAESAEPETGSTELQKIERQIVPGFVNEYQIEGLKAFLRFWDADNTLSLGLLTVSYWSLYILLLAAGLLTMYLLRGEEDIRSIRLCVIGVLVGFWAYALVTVAGCLLVFNSAQAGALQGFERYMRSYYLAAFLTLFALLLSRRSAKQNLALALGVLCFSLTAVSPRDAAVDAAGLHRSKRAEPEGIADTLSVLDAETDRVAFVAPGDSGMALNCARYYVLPLYLEDGGADVSAENAAEAWEKALLASGYTHVYIYQTDDAFTEAFSSLFADADSIGEHTLFTIVQTAGGVRLEEYR